MSSEVIGFSFDPFTAKLPEESISCTLNPAFFEPSSKKRQSVQQLTLLKNIHFS